MNVTVRKLAMLQKNLEQMEERSRIEGYTTYPVDSELKRRVNELMSKIRVI